MKNYIVTYTQYCLVENTGSAFFTRVFASDSRAKLEKHLKDLRQRFNDVDIFWRGLMITEAGSVDKDSLEASLKKNHGFEKIEEGLVQQICTYVDDGEGGW
jgi:hypothetical protein